jgi:hypothetical protein
MTPQSCGWQGKVAELGGERSYTSPDSLMTTRLGDVSELLYIGKNLHYRWCGRQRASALHVFKGSCAGKPVRCTSVEASQGTKPRGARQSRLRLFLQAYLRIRRPCKYPRRFVLTSRRDLLFAVLSHKPPRCRIRQGRSGTFFDIVQ